MKKLSIFLIVCFMCFFSNSIFAQTYSGGYGSANDPYRISSKADIDALANAVGGGKLYSGNYFLLTQDITESVTSIIGKNYNQPFKGVFDGGGHTVAANISSTENYIGMFGCIESATIKNLYLTGSVAGTSDVSYNDVGSICGYAYLSTITNCYSTTNVSVVGQATSAFQYYAGGICGYADKSVITDCYNMGDISSSISSQSASSYVGGICGIADVGSVISNCYNIGKTDVNGSLTYAGGISGMASYSSKISNCFVSNEINSSNLAGRILGRNFQSTIENCYADAGMLVNGIARNEADANSDDGKDTSNSSFQSQSWIEGNLYWDFINTWTMSDVNSPNRGYPIFKSQSTPITYTVTISPSDNGNVSASTYSGTEGTTVTLTITPNPGYELDNISACKTGDETTGVTLTGADNTCTFIMPAYDVTVTAIFKKTLSLSVSPVSLDFADIGEQQTFTITSNTDWTVSSDAPWLTVSPASGNNDGTVTVTAEANTATTQRTATIIVSGTGVTEQTVSVTQAEVSVIPVTAVSLDNTSVSMQVSETKQLTATIEPSDATNPAVTWSSSNEAIATVDKNGLITAVGVGTATITVFTEDVNISATCIVTVSPKLGILDLNTETGAYLHNDRLYIKSPVAETIQVYSENGVLLYNFQKPAGEINYIISNIQDLVLIVKGSSGWVKKVVK